MDGWVVEGMSEWWNVGINECMEVGMSDFRLIIFLVCFCSKITFRLYVVYIYIYKFISDK